MRKYFMYNWEETKEIFIGSFINDINFFNHYWDNENSIKDKQKTLDGNSSWHWTKF